MSSPFTESPPEDYLRLPPLRIHHLMLWTAVSAVMFTVLKTETNSNDFSSSLEVGSIPSLLIYSICLTGLLLGLFWKHRGCFFFDEPGQMAFIIHGIIIVYMLVSASATSYFETDQWTSDFAAIHVVLGLGLLVVCIVQLVLYFKFSRKFSYTDLWGKFFMQSESSPYCNM